jgi:hypothetical protein
MITCKDKQRDIDVCIPDSHILDLVKSKLLVDMLIYCEM